MQAQGDHIDLPFWSAGDTRKNPSPPALADTKWYQVSPGIKPVSLIP